jgi:hypothetical protein
VKAKKFTKKDFEEFRKHVFKWQSLLGLGNFRIYLEFDAYGDPSTIARVGYSTKEGWARILLNSAHPRDDAHDEPLEVTALHEVFHLVIARIDELTLPSSDEAERANEQATSCFVNFIVNHYLPLERKICNRKRSR